MKALKKILMVNLFLFAICCTGFVYGQSADAVMQKASAAISGGNAASLAGLCNSSVEVTVPGSDKTYSSQQVQFVLKDFFTKNPPKGFRVVHKGNSGATHYATGTYTSSSGAFDTNLFVKNIGGKFVITQIRFEAE